MAKRQVEVLEEWGPAWNRQRLVVTQRGHIVAQWRGYLSGHWWTWEGYDDVVVLDVPLFWERGV